MCVQHRLAGRHPCARVLWTRSYGWLWDTSHGCWKWNLGPLEEQWMFLTGEPSFQPRGPKFRIYFFPLNIKHSYGNVLLTKMLAFMVFHDNFAAIIHLYTMCHFSVSAFSSFPLLKFNYNVFWHVFPWLSYFCFLSFKIHSFVFVV